MPAATGAEHREQGKRVRVVRRSMSAKLTSGAEVPVNYQSDRRGCPACFDEDHEGEAGSALAELNSSMHYCGITDNAQDAFIAETDPALSGQFIA